MLGKSKRFRGTQVRKSPKNEPPRSFGDGAVGLGIVAAMSGGGDSVGSLKPKATANPNPIRSDPIPIAAAAAAVRVGPTPGEWEELSESYTCVISHVGGKSVKKRVYLDDGAGGNFAESSGVFFESPPPPVVAPPGVWGQPVDFLSLCYLCRKKLHGLDIFMYRGEKAFCSVECRCQQILSDENKEKCRSGATKPLDSISPYPTASLLFSAGVAAA